MFRKYEKTYRLSVPGFEPPSNKFVLSKQEVKIMLSGKVTIEEKMDGANVGIIRTEDGFRLQKRGSLVDTSEHEQFNFFKAWAHKHYDNIMSIPPRYIVYGELMYAVHHIYYDSLPDWFLVFDVMPYNKHGKQNHGYKNYMNYREKKEFCEKHGFSMVPYILTDHIKIQEIPLLVPKKSAYGDRAEGIVLKRYNKRENWRAKVVWPDFVKEIDEDNEHWTRRILRTNKLIKGE